MSASPLTPERSATEDHTRWFETQVRPHEAALRGYLRGAFPAVRDVDDVVQESLVRTWRARALQPIHSAKAFLFTVGRRLALDVVRREAISPLRMSGDLRQLSVMEDRTDVAASLDEKEKIRLLAEAVGALPLSCREIIILHRIHGLTQREVAERLGLSEKTVEHRVATGVKRCETFFRRRGIEYF